MSRARKDYGMDKDLVGARGEFFAAKFLEIKNYKISHKNWRCKAGEIDIIARSPVDTVFVEVKTRLARPGSSERIFDNIDLRKRKKLLLLKDIYLNRFRLGRAIPSHRIDLIGVILNREDLEVVEIRHAISAV